MCLLALFYHVVEDCPVIVGANREEFYLRGGDPPTLLDSSIPVVAGVDPHAGGTWLGVNSRRVLVAVTNRHKTRLPHSPRSRGRLALDLLTNPTAYTAAEKAAHELSQERYAGCNILCVDDRDAIVIQAGDWLRIRPLPPGIHVLTNHDINDASDRRLGYALSWLSERQYLSSAACVTALQELCRQNGNPSPPICIRGETKGTVSSSIIALRHPSDRSLYLHAQGSPDTTPYQDYSYLIRQITAQPAGD